jgi:hypothetical protein
MTKFSYSIHMALAGLLMLSAACNRASEQAEVVPPVNYVVLLDLSDRLLHADQAAHDIAQLETAFEAFAEQVRNRLYILSEDRFQVRILPQKGSRLHAEQYENSLSLDMKALAVTERADALDKLAAAFPAMLRQLYEEALLGQKKSDFAGVDIWKYFKYRLPEDLPANYQHKVLVLTDGYFDFEDLSHILREGNRFTHSGFLREPGIKSADWLKHAEQQDYGYIPVSIGARPQIIISGIRPKSEHLAEEEKLHYFWEKWLRESCGTPGFFIADASRSIMSRQLREFLRRDG